MSFSFFPPIATSAVGYGKCTGFGLAPFEADELISVSMVPTGDLIPASNVGKLFGGFFIVCGILIALLPVPILSSKFERIYNEICECSRNKKNQTKAEDEPERVQDAKRS